MYNTLLKAKWTIGETVIGYSLSIIRYWLQRRRIIAARWLFVSLALAGHAQTKVGTLEKKLIKHGLVDIQNLDPTLKVELK